MDLESRERDYDNMIWYEQRDPADENNFTWVQVCLLPEPFNMGESWYPEARKRIEAYNFKAWDVRSREWNLPQVVKRSHIWNWMTEVKFWESWEEWTTMMGF